MGRYQGMVISGYGGQGILTVGMIIAQAGIMEGLEVSWMPSYGPEMRGGTAYVHVIMSDEQIGSPILNSATSLIAMNSLSFAKYQDMVVDGGIILVDGSLVHEKLEDDRREFFSLPATKIATDKYTTSSYANIILMGKLIARTNIVKAESFEKALYVVLPDRYHSLIPAEMEMLRLGMEYQG